MATLAPVPRRHQRGERTALPVRTDSAMINGEHAIVSKEDGGRLDLLGTHSAR